MTEVTRVMYKSCSQSDPRIYMDQSSKDLTVARGSKTANCRKDDCARASRNKFMATINTSSSNARAY